jgi:uncharacterized phage protein gp47/JayE
MSFVNKSYEDIANAILSQIANGVVQEQYTYLPDGGDYVLSYPEGFEIVKVEGVRNGYPYEFARDADYVVADHHLAWLDGSKPDGHTSFRVYRRAGTPAEITDVNPGSVIRTIVEAIAVEMDFLYAQMEAVYDASFVDTATGQALDLVVAMLGVNRKPAGYAVGEVTFGRSAEPQLFNVTREAMVYDGKAEYPLKNGPVKAVQGVEGTAGGAAAMFAEGVDYRLAGDRIAWLSPGKKPDKGSILYVSYAYHEKIVVPKGATVSTYSRNPENVRSFEVLRDTPLALTREGKWEASIPVIAAVPGKAGNAYAGSITAMPSPVPGISYVVNKSDIVGGTEVESDDALRARARRALERAGKATLRALQLAVQGVEGVSGEVIVIDRPDGVPGIIQVIASGGDEQEIAKAIEETRSAGIKVEFKRPTSVPLDVRVTVYLAAGASREDVRLKVDAAVRDYLSRLEIGDDVIVSRIIEAAVGVPGVRDARDVTINDRGDNVLLKEDEKADCRLLEFFMEV